MAEQKIIEITIGDVSKHIKEFKKRNAIDKIIAFSGGSDEKETEVKSIVDEALQKLKNFSVAILTGGTKFGIPQFATQSAKNLNIKIIGILPIVGRKHALPSDDFDLQIFVAPSFAGSLDSPNIPHRDLTTNDYSQSFWGDESPLFAKLADAMIVIGGGSGTLIEIAHAMKINETLIKPDSPRLPIFIVPVLGVSGVSEVINFLPFKENVRQKVLPISERIFTGRQASDFLIRKLNLYENEFITSSNLDSTMQENDNIPSNQNNLVEPKTLSGFRDILPSLALVKEDMLYEVKKVFRKFGFAPIETPHLEYTEILLGKGSDEIQKQLYRFRDNGNRDVTLRFDHTVPLARFVVQHKTELGLPFKRYAVGNVFRGESPQSGRYREFTQCDFDFIGTYSTTADAEIVQVIFHSLKALQINDFTIYLNNRKIMNGLAEKINASDKVGDILRTVDKINKIGSEQVQKLLISEVGLSQEATDEVMRFIVISQRETQGNFFEFIANYKNYNATMKEGIEELEFLYKILEKSGIDSRNYTIDFSIARGLGYYTGIVYETTLDKLPKIGAVASGGRFDNLTKSFSNDNLPGVGASIGIDRLIAALEQLEIIKSRNTPAKVLIANVDNNYIADSYVLANALRDANIAVEVYPEVAKLNKQFAFADKKGHQYLIVFGENEATKNEFVVANLQTGDKIPAKSISDLIQLIG